MPKMMWLTIVAASIAALVWSPDAEARQCWEAIDFTWTAPTDNVDGSPFNADTETSRWSLYCDEGFGFGEPTVEILTATARAYQGSLLEFPPNNYTCHLTVTDLALQESLPSNTVQFFTCDAPPNPPSLGIQ